jgi:beta-glucosidase
LGKIATAGRNWEGFGPDPYLTGIAMAETITGMQAAGVQACAKHYLGNEQEKNRETMSSNIADRANHELYLWYVHDSSFSVQNPNGIGPLRMQSKPTSLL